MHLAIGRSSLLRLFAIGVAGSSLVVAACGPGGGGTSPTPGVASAYNPQKGSQGGTLFFSDWESPGDLNVIGDSAATTYQAAAPAYAQLWTTDPQNKYVADQAAEIPTQANGDVKQVDSTHMDVTVKLKSGLKWSDGTPVTVQDYIFTWNAICDPNTGATSTVGYDHIVSMEAKSDTEMVWHFGPDPTGKRCGLSSPLQNGIYAAYLILGLPPLVPLPRSVLGNVPHSSWATHPYFNTKPSPVTGPYEIVNFSPGSGGQIVYTPNPHYNDGRSGTSGFNHAPYLDKLVYKFYGDKASQVNGLRTNDTQLGLDLIAKDLPSVQGIPNVKAESVTGLLDEFLSYNVGNNEKGCQAQKYAATCGTPTIFKDDPTMRQAFNLAIDKAAINTQLVQGIGKVMNCLFVSSLKPYYDSGYCDGSNAWHRDVSKANSMLDSDGWTKGPDGIRTKNGRKCEYTISSTTGNPQRAAEEEIIFSSTRDIGCVGTADNHPASDLFAGYASNGVLATGQFDVGMYANNWAADPDSWGSVIETAQIPSTSFPAGGNWGRCSDPKLDQLFAQGVTTLDIAKRQSIYSQVEREESTYQCFTGLYERPDVSAVNTTFGNFFINASSSLSTWNVVDWFRKSS